MLKITLAFFIFTSDGQPPFQRLIDMPTIEKCWIEAAIAQKFYAENHPKMRHFQIDISCISEWEYGDSL